jgi:hypothetical protein
MPTESELEMRACIVQLARGTSIYENSVPIDYLESLLGDHIDIAGHCAALDRNHSWASFDEVGIKITDKAAASAYIKSNRGRAFE